MPDGNEFSSTWIGLHRPVCKDDFVKGRFVQYSPINFQNFIHSDVLIISFVFFEIMSDFFFSHLSSKSFRNLFTLLFQCCQHYKMRPCCECVLLPVIT